MDNSDPKKMVMYSILLIESLKGYGSKTIFKLTENYINNTKKLLSDKHFSVLFDETEYQQLERVLKDDDKFKSLANNLSEGKKEDTQEFSNFLNLTGKVHEISYLRSLR